MDTSQPKRLPGFLLDNLHTLIYTRLYNDTTENRRAEDADVEKEIRYDGIMRRGGTSKTDYRLKEDDTDNTLGRRQKMTEHRSMFNKILVTICLIGVWISMGLFMEIAGPTLKDFKLRLNTSYESISNAVSGRSIGKFIGVVLGGFFVDKFGNLCHFLLCVALTMAAATIVTLPWVTSLDLLWFMYLLLGTTLGLINIGGQRIIFTVWLEKSASPMHVVHLGYGVGGFIAPLLVNPFLADFPADDVTTTAPLMSTTFDDVTINGTTNAQPVSKIQYAYTIVGIITACFAVIFLLYQIVESRNAGNGSAKVHQVEKTKNAEQDDATPNKRSLLQMINPATCADGNFCFGFSILFLLFLKFFFLTGVDRTLGTFLRSYAIDQLHFSKNNATYINTIYWVAYAVGRFIAFLVAFCVSVKIILVLETIGVLLTGFCMVLFALDHPLALWILTGCIGLLMGPMFPTGIAWGDTYIEMTGLAITWTLLGSAFGGLTFFRLGGFAYDKYGPPAMAYIYLCAVIILATFDSILTVLGLCKKRITGEKEKHNTTEQIKDVQIEMESYKKDS